MTGAVVWFTGLPASGKSTLARRVRDRLAALRCIVLDSDEIREALGADRYEASSRDELYRALGALATLLARQGHIVLVAATAPLRAHRAGPRGAAPRYFEVWVNAPLAACEARDIKGLYARARAGDAPDLPGVGATYEPPLDSDVIAQGGFDDVAVARIEQLVTGSTPAT
jgi:adenylylsulfate kinase